MNAQFTNIHAAADYIGPGAIEVPLYQTEIIDIVRRRGIFGQRIKQVPATGHPSRFFEETRHPLAVGSLRLRRSAQHRRPAGLRPRASRRSVPLKALVAQINYNLFDIELGKQQSQFAYLQAKDLADTVDGVLRTHDVALWNGTDTSLILAHHGAVLRRGARRSRQAATPSPSAPRRASSMASSRTDRADGLELLLRRSSHGHLRQSRAARPHRSRDEVGVQRRPRHARRSPPASRSRCSPRRPATSRSSPSGRCPTPARRAPALPCCLPTSSPKT